MQRNFLVVSEDPGAREALAERLRSGGAHVILAEDGTEALRVARSVAVDVVFLECRGPAPGVRSLRDRLLRERPEARVVPLTSFGAIRSSTELLRFGRGDFLVSADDLLTLIPPTPREETARAAIDEGIRSLVDTLDVLVGLLELGDRYFAGSAHRTMRLARSVAEELGLDAWSVQEISIAALLRDLGKVGVERDVRDSTEPFTLEEFERMKEHVDAGVRLLEHVDYPWKILPVVRHHHERYDGRGYPDGLRGREIPLGARILGAVDAYVALTSDRPHRPAVDPTEALDALEKGAGHQFDPEIIEILIRLVDQRPGLAGGEHGSVVLVDAQADYREPVQLRLLNEGFQVHEFDDLDVALAALDDASPDVLLIDPGVAGDDVLGFLRRLRDDERLDRLPIVLLARRDDPVLKLRALRQGVDEWFVKSGDLEELSARVENLLLRERRRASAGTRRRRGVSGNLANFSLPEIVQTLVIGTKTACVRLHDGTSKGQLWFRDGTLVHARRGKLRGREAFWALLRWPEGDFVIEHGVVTSESSIDEDPMFLVMEGLRLQDEESSGPDSAVL